MANRFKKDRNVKTNRLIQIYLTRIFTLKAQVNYFLISSKIFTLQFILSQKHHYFSSLNLKTK